MRNHLMLEVEGVLELYELLIRYATRSMNRNHTVVCILHSCQVELQLTEVSAIEGYKHLASLNLVTHVNHDAVDVQALGSWGNVILLIWENL